MCWPTCRRSRTANEQTEKTRLLRPGFFRVLPLTLHSCVATLDQAIGATFGYTTFQQTIGAAFGYTAFNQAIRPAFSDDGLGGSGGESVNCKNREGDAEKDLAFHDGVLRGVIGWYGADVTPEIFYENFIELMVTIDASNGCQSPITGQ